MTSEITPRWMAVGMLLLCLVCGAASAQTGAIMRVVLSDNNFLPAANPYCTPTGVNFLGATPQFTDRCTEVSVISVPGTALVGGRNHGVVDWVAVELRETAGASADDAGGGTVIARKPALLLSNGRVVDAVAFEALSSADRNSCATGGSGVSLATSTTCPDVVFDGVSVNDNLYIVVHHRNHLPVISADSVTASGNVYMYDFASGVTQARNSGQKIVFGQVGLDRRPGVAMMIAGDVSGDGRVLPASDRNAIVTTVGSAPGYLENDVNLNAAIAPADDLVDLNQSNLGAVSQVPQ